MAKYVYPAVFTAEDNGLYSINFPDIESCYTSGEGLADALDMASDVLCLRMYTIENENGAIPVPSDPKSITLADNEIVTYVSCDTLEYRKMFDSKAIKKTLTIPSWMNTMAESANVNFSAVLQEALMQKLNLK